MDEAIWKFTGAKTKQLIVDGVPESGRHRSHTECLEDFSKARRKRLKPIWAKRKQEAKEAKTV